MNKTEKEPCRFVLLEIMQVPDQLPNQRGLDAKRRSLMAGGDWL
jgi:hypothetical protein